MTRTWLFVVLILIIAGGTFAFRLAGLGQRPMHTDEAVHAVKFDTLWESGAYRYDLNEYHGPTLYYCTLPFAWLSGARDFGELSAATLRLVAVVFGAGLIVLLLLIGDGLGRAAAVCAGVLTALSPAMMFYGRYYIQEPLLIFFTFLAIVAGWRYVRSRHLGWAILTGAALGLMHATKETSVIAFGALAVALVITVVWHRRSRRVWPEYGRQAAGGSRPQYGRAAAVAGAAIIGIGLSVTLYSGFFTNAAGPLDSLRTYVTYFDRAGGHGLHDHPWHYYVGMLAYTHYVPGPWWSEGLILALALAGMVAAVTGRGVGGGHVPLLRFLTLYTLLLTVIYSAIPYKTPWCLLGFLHGMILLGGVGAVALVCWVPFRPVRITVAVLVLGAAAQLGWQARQASFRFCADYRNPYVYAHPRFELVELAERVEQLAGVHPDGRAMLTKVVVPDPWPLPWYLRRLSRVGYWEEVPEQPDAPVIIAATELQQQLDQHLQDAYQVNYYGMRAPSVVLALYIERELWNEYVERRLRTQTQPSGAALP
jgi:uncharacterized protein (TIGR03663 family)